MPSLWAESPPTMSHVLVTIKGSATGSTATDRIGHWSSDLQLLTDLHQPDPRPNAHKVLNGELVGATQNQAMLEAIRQALTALKREGLTITIVTTNPYLIGVLARHWKPSRNHDLIAEIKALMGKHTVHFQKPA